MADGEQFTLTLTEAESMARRIVTKDEAAEDAARRWWAGRRPDLFSPPAPRLEYDFRPSGRLLLDINAFHFDKPKEVARIRQWSDQRDRRLEDQLPDAINGMHMAAAGARRLRLAAEEAQRRHDEIERQHKLAEIENELRLQQDTLFQEGAAALRRLHDLNALADHLEREALAAEGFGLEALRERLSQSISEWRAAPGAEALRNKWARMEQEAERRRRLVRGSKK